MDNQKFNLFLDKLLEKTENKKLEWEKTADRDTFLVVLKDSAVSIRQDFNENFGFDEIINKWSYTFDFRDENGNVIESVTASKSDESQLKKAERIFEIARQQSLKSDQTIDRILEQIAA